MLNNQDYTACLADGVKVGIARALALRTRQRVSLCRCGNRTQGRHFVVQSADRIPAAAL